MKTLEAALQLAAARYLRWMPNSNIRVSKDEIEISGWALNIWDEPDTNRFIVNGVDMDEVQWPMTSPDIEQHFGLLPHAAMARFHCRHRVPPGSNPFPGGFARFNVTGPQGEHGRTYRTAWFLADPQIEIAPPSGARIERVIGAPDTDFFRIGGATIVNRIEHLLIERLGRPLHTFEHVLDWGCGAGRLTRYLRHFNKNITGVDIDADNLAGCREAMPDIAFRQVGLMPPGPFDDGSFDLAIGLSVVTHLAEDALAAWLKELKRLVKPGGILLLSIQGTAQLALNLAPPSLPLAIHRAGFYEKGPNPQLDGMISDPDYYRDVLYSHDYIFAQWQSLFDVLDIVEGIAGNQDIVILHRRND